MIIYFHTHIFPDKIAHRAVCNLERIGRVAAYTDGTLDDLSSSGDHRPGLLTLQHGVRDLGSVGQVGDA